MIQRVEAIVLRTFRYGDNSIIADLFTDGDGHLSIIVPVGKTKTSRYRAQLLRPLSVLSVDYVSPRDGGLARVKDMHLAVAQKSIPFDEAKLNISIFLAELLTRTLHGEPANAPLFAYIKTSVEWLDNATTDYLNFHLVFLMRLTRFLGFYPNLSDAADFFDLRGACFSSTAPLHPDFLRGDEAQKVLLLMRMDYETMRLFHITKEERNRCVEVLLDYYRLHLPDFPELKSFEILKELSK